MPEGDMRVSRLLQEGWKILEKTEALERHEGLAPYEDLDRIVHVSTYRMGKSGKIILCRIAYDSQRDHSAESCERRE